MRDQLINMQKVLRWRIISAQDLHDKAVLAVMVSPFQKPCSNIKSGLLIYLEFLPAAEPGSFTLVVWPG